MDFLNEKLNSMTGPALSRVNEYRRRRQEERQRQSSDQPASKQQPIREPETSRNIVKHESSMLASGTPFGGDTQNLAIRSPPPIGFRKDLIDSNKQHDQQNEQPKHPQLNLARSSSEASLYQADTWSRLWFQRIMLLSLVRLLLFVRKVYEDYHATKTYNGLPNHLGHFLMAASSLFLPTIVFTIYRLCRYLQVALPQRRAIKTGHPYPTTSSLNKSSQQESSQDESHLRQALIGHSVAPSPAPGNKPLNQQSSNEDEGLVTARQTPTNEIEFQDSRSQQDLSESIEPAKAEAQHESNKQQIKEDVVGESVKVEKLGDLPDRETIRVTIGASEQLLHGILFVFWQLKRQVDVMSYLVERSCLWRKPSEREREQLEQLRTGSDGLEWFQDFYAAFLAILTQVYILVSTWTGNGFDSSTKISRVSSGQTALGSIATLDAPDLSISGSAKALSEVLSQQAAALKGEDVLIASQLIVSMAVVGSLLIAVRRKDDGSLTLALSMLGWGSTFSSRIIILAMAFAVLGWRLMLSLVALHVIGITCWIYKISLDSFNNRISERGDEIKWTRRPAAQEAEGDEELSLKMSRNQKSTSESSDETDKWSSLEHLALLTQIVTLFALPSLFYWPIMFNLKSHQRPFKYLALIMSQNLTLMALVWLTLSGNQMATAAQWYLLGAVGGFSIAGFIFVSLYVACKPSLTEYFARADEIFNDAERAGIYFEFCSRIFKMPDLNKESFKRLMDQTEEIVIETGELANDNNQGAQ